MTVWGQRRWYAKKAARAAVAYGAWASGGLAMADFAAPGARVRVLTYHRFGQRPYDPFCVPPELFEAQVRWLADEGRAISLADLQAFLRHDRTLPRDAALVTIDDGFLSTHTIAAPILQRYGVPAVAFVSTALVGSDVIAPDGGGERYMTWDEVERIREAGVAVGSHASTHRSMGRLPIEEAREEIARSYTTLRQRLGDDAPSFAYPYGTVGHFSDETDRAVAGAGFSLAFTSLHGAIRPGRKGIGLPRVKVESGEGLRMFKLLCRGAMDPWTVVDQGLGRVG